MRKRNQTNPASSREKKLLAAVEYFLLQNLHENFSIEQIAHECNTSEFFVDVRFHEITGKTVVQFVKEQRLIRAKQQLQNGASVKQAAIDAHYTPKAFSKEFKKYFGASPKHYINR